MAEVESVDKQHENNKKRVVGKPFPKGVSGNPKGRPVGKSMKEFARMLLSLKTDEAKLEWLKDIPKETLWRMAEGNPPQDIKIEGEIPFQIIEIGKIKKASDDSTIMLDGNGNPISNKTG